MNSSNAIHLQPARVQARFEANATHGVENAIESGARRWFTGQGHRSHAEVIKDVEAWMRHGDFAAKRKAHRVFVSSDAEVTGRLSAISCPALVMTGDRDAGSTPAMARQMADAIPDVELQILDDQHHMMPVLDADRVNAVILQFLPRVSGEK